MDVTQWDELLCWETVVLNLSTPTCMVTFSRVIQLVLLALVLPCDMWVQDHRTDTFSTRAEHLQEFPKSIPNPWFLQRWEIITLQQLLIHPSKLLALRKKPHIRVKLRALSVARILFSRTVSSVARTFCHGSSLRAKARRPEEKIVTWDRSGSSPRGACQGRRRT
jgi:hypothetical protein